MSSALIYDIDLFYSQHMDEKSQRNLMRFYRKLFDGYSIATIHDCSIGAGGSTLPLSKLGYIVSGSDLSENMINGAKINFENNGFSPNLFVADLRDFGDSLKSERDCIISTGNSLPHVDLDGFNSFLRSAASRLTEDGLLFFDIRNWDAIATERPLIQVLVSGMVSEEEHRSVFHLFNWHDNGSVTFSFVTCVDNNGKVSLDIMPCPTYYPLLKRDILQCFAENGFRLLRWVDMDNLMFGASRIKVKKGNFDADFDNIQWYGVLAQKTSGFRSSSD